MQQAYSVLRVVAEAQTIRLVLSPLPTRKLLAELCTACSALHDQSSNGVKAVILDIQSQEHASTTGAPGIADDLDSRLSAEALAAIEAVEQPVVSVVRATPSPALCALLQAADLVLLAAGATLISNQAQTGTETVSGEQALRLGLATWSVPENAINEELERILDMLRAKSAIALRHAKASVRLASSYQQTASNHEAPTEPHTSASLAALKQVNAFYLAEVMRTADAAEGLNAFLEKRQPQWKNH